VTPILGLLMLLGVALGAVTTGLPVWGILIGVANLGAALTMLTGAIEPGIFFALPNRVVGLLESDLLQALPLFAAMGALLNRLPLADTLFRAGLGVSGGRPTGAPAAALMLGAVLGPMNGSVSANAIALTRSVEPGLTRRHVRPADRIALIAVASTLGVLVPPSLVLILLGDAMMAAHTIALNSTGRIARIVNTQDVFRGAMLPAALFLGACLVIATVRGLRTRGTSTLRERLSLRDWITAGATLCFIATLLAGVASGAFYAVEAAAMGAVGLCLAGWLGGGLDGPRLRGALDDTIAMTGALLALLIAATTFTLVFRILGSDKLIASWMSAAPGGPLGIVLLGLGIVALAAFVLDAFEIIFVLIPIIMPPMLMRADDAVWVAVLTLLVLQTSFLLPPLGYALMMTRSAASAHAPLGAIAKSLAPFLIAQMLIVAAVIAWPALTHPGRSSQAIATQPTASEADIQQRFQQMMPPPLEMPDLGPPKL
jgi:tripartite ATP-independent transporter DctM subunit